MNHKHDTDSQQDRELSRRFRQVREQDAQRAPEFPGEDALARRRPIVASSQLFPTLQKLAVAAAVVVAVGILMSRAPAPPEQDPGVLYADIMSANSMTTDQFLLVSLSVSPEMTRMPGIYEIDLPIAPAEITN